MRHLLLVCLALTLLGCGSRIPAPEPLTIQEYAIWCEKTGWWPHDDAITRDLLLGNLRWLISEYRTTAPPRELQKMHEHRLARFEGMYEYVRESPFNSRDQMNLLDGEGVFIAGVNSAKEKRKLPAETQSLLEAYNCWPS